MIHSAKMIAKRNPAHSTLRYLGYFNMNNLQLREINCITIYRFMFQFNVVLNCCP